MRAGSFWTLVVPWLVLLVDIVSCGCRQQNMCCSNRNLSCVSTDNDYEQNFITFQQANPGSQNKRRQRHSQVVIEQLVEPKRYSAILIDKLRQFSKSESSTVLEDQDFSSVIYDDVGADIAEESYHHTPTATDKPSTKKVVQLPVVETSYQPVDFVQDDEDDDEVIPDSLLQVLHFGAFDNEDEDAAVGESKRAPKDTIEYADNGNDKEIRYVIVNGKRSFEKLAHLKYFGQHASKQKKCFCDEVCRKSGDCCLDYNQFCPLVDCQVSQWSDWSSCKALRQRRRKVRRRATTRCGTGVRKRSRSIMVEKMNGGLHCPHLAEQASCFVDDRSCYFQNQIALLLDYDFGVARVPGYRKRTYYDMPKRVAEWNEKNNSCVIFQSIWHNNCKLKNFDSLFRRTARICVECQPTAQLMGNGMCPGEGDGQAASHWSYIGGRECMGQWTRVNKQGNCKCSTNFSELPRFVFV